MNQQPVYWTDPYQSEFGVRTLKCQQQDGRYHVRISDPVVKPSGGGQAGDKGILIAGTSEIRFDDCVKDDEGLVVVTDSLIPEGSSLTLRIDMKWRRAMMRNHTGEHLFVRSMIEANPDAELGTIWIDGRHGTAEIIGGDISYDSIFNAESKVQKAIEEALEVTTRVVEAGDVDESVRAREGVTSKHERLRIVDIKGFDQSACSGIHVTNTAEIGVFKIVDFRIEERHARMEFMTGPAALEMVSSVYNQVLTRKHEYPFEMEQIGAVLDKSKGMVESRDALVESLFEALATGPVYSEVGGISLRSEYLPGLDAKMLRNLANRMQIPDQSILLLFTPGDMADKKCNLVLRTEGTPNDASSCVAELVSTLGGRGGGSHDAYTGGFTDVKDARALFESLVAGIRRILS
jgi:alanyl-tRNA synthetase